MQRAEVVQAYHQAYEHDHACRRLCEPKILEMRIALSRSRSSQSRSIEDVDSVIRMNSLSAPRKNRCALAIHLACGLHTCDASSAHSGSA